jgi:hypothetical protein
MSLKTIQMKKISISHTENMVLLSFQMNNFTISCNSLQALCKIHPHAESRRKKEKERQKGLRQSSFSIQLSLFVGRRA